VKQIIFLKMQLHSHKYWNKLSWVITDEEGVILGLPDSPYDVNFDNEAPAGTCLVGI
jgi:hypothetical protein